MGTIAAKTCRVCHQDVTNAKRVKDAQGNYYCAACHEKLLAGKGATPAAAPLKVPVGGAAPAKEPEAGRAKLPEFCPNCGAKVFAGRKLCIKAIAMSRRWTR